MVSGDEPPELGQVGGSYNQRMVDDWATNYKRKARGESVTNLEREEVLRDTLGCQTIETIDPKGIQYRQKSHSRGKRNI